MDKEPKKHKNPQHPSGNAVKKRCAVTTKSVAGTDKRPSEDFFNNLSYKRTFSLLEFHSGSPIWSKVARARSDLARSLKASAAFTNPFAEKLGLNSRTSWAAARACSIRLISA